MKYYAKVVIAGGLYISGVSLILRDTSEQYYRKKNQEIENLRANIYQAKVKLIFIYIGWRTRYIEC